MVTFQTHALGITFESYMSDFKMENIIYKYIQIVELEPSIFYKKPVKTKIFQVRNHLYNCNLGWIKWQNGWRRYAFFPEPETFYEEVCMKDIYEFIEKLNSDKKEEDKLRKK